MKAVTLPVLPLIGILFVGLKLTGHIAWPWLWVLAPFWGPLAAVLVILLFIGLVAGAVALIR